MRLFFVTDREGPANAVWCEVLNLQKQVGVLPGDFALAQAYRILAQRWNPNWWVLAQNRWYTITNTAGHTYLIP